MAIEACGQEIDILLIKTGNKNLERQKFSLVSILVVRLCKNLQKLRFFFYVTWQQVSDTPFL